MVSHDAKKENEYKNSIKLTKKGCFEHVWTCLNTSERGSVDLRWLNPEPDPRFRFSQMLNQDRTSGPVRGLNQVRRGSEPNFGNTTSTTLLSLRLMPQFPGDRHVEVPCPWRGGNVRGLPISPVLPHSFLSFPITFYSLAIISNLVWSFPISRDHFHRWCFIANHHGRPHSIARHRPA
jgi:hypothetical protein